MANPAENGSMMCVMSWTQELFTALAEAGPRGLLRIGPESECAKKLRELCRKNKKKLTELEPFRQKKNIFLLLRDALLAHNIVCINADQDRSELYELLLFCEECMREQGIHPVFAFCNASEHALISIVEEFLENMQYELFVQGQTKMAMAVAPVIFAQKKGLKAHLESSNWEKESIRHGKRGNEWELQKAEARARFLKSMREKEILDFGWAWEVARREQGVSRGDWKALEKENSNLQRKLHMLRQAWDQLKKSQERLQFDLDRMLRSKSWKLTAPLRKTEAWLRKLPREHPEPVDRTNAAQQHPPAATGIAVVIPCHNYGKYLTECIESVLQQTHPPKEILVVDDSSEDDTPSVAKDFSGRGVRYLRGEWRDVCKARNAGAAATNTPYLIFLDADDLLAADYIEQCLVKMRNPTVAVAYGYPLQFGDRNQLVAVPEYDEDMLMRRNFITSNAMIRRQAFDMVGGYLSHHHTHQDWDFYKRILRLPWKAARANTHFLYRTHTDSNFYRSQQTKDWQYVQRATLHHHPISIFTLFTGRNELLRKYMDALHALDFDQKLLQLHCYDASSNAAFGRQLRNVLAPLAFGCMAYTNATVPGNQTQAPEDTGNRTAGNTQTPQYRNDLAIIYAYNQFLKTCDTEFVLAVADDVLPAPASLKTLLDAVEEDVVAVAAPCLSRRTQDCWDIWNTDPADRKMPLKTRGKGTEEIGGSEFGCVLFRMSALKKVSISTDAQWNPERQYDRLVFDQLWNHGRVLCNWDARAEREYTDLRAGRAQSISPSFS